MSGWTGPVFPLPPLNLKWPVTRTVRWNATRADAISGKRTRYSNWTYPQYHYELGVSFMRQYSAFNEWQTFETFVDSVQGAAQLWGYVDPNDNSVTGQTFGVGDGMTTNFQLVRALAGVGGFVSPIYLLNGTPSIYQNGVSTPPAGGISPYGVVQFGGAPAPGVVLTWTGSFYQPCRFDDDDTVMKNFLSGFFSADKLAFTTEKLP